MSERSRIRKLRRDETADRVLAVRRENLIHVREPLVLIAQPNRSGGTLLTQLLDGHPELHVHPGELQWDGWPSLDLSDPPEAIFSALRERHVVKGLQRGYTKDRPARKAGYNDQLQSFPLMLDPFFFRELFAGLVRERAVETQRDVLDRYFTALHNAWLDNQNLYVGPKRWVIVFRGKMRHEENLAGFIADYPDGRFITCVREPKAMIASRMTYDLSRARASNRDLPPIDQDDVRQRADGWRRSTEEQLDIKARDGDQVFLLTFDQLVTATDATMRALATWLGIHFERSLTEPTFNRFPIKANSSFRVDRYGVRPEARENWRGVLDEEQAEIIDAETRELYERVCALAA